MKTIISALIIILLFETAFSGGLYMDSNYLIRNEYGHKIDKNAVGVTAAIMVLVGVSSYTIADKDKNKKNGTSNVAKAIGAVFIIGALSFVGYIAHASKFDDVSLRLSDNSVMFALSSKF